MPASVQFEDNDKGMRSIIEEIESEGGFVDIGVQSDEEEELLVIAAANEFGATIKHKGGTSFGFKTKKDAIKGKVRFLKKGKGFMELGKTSAHEIKIPARPYIRGTIDSKRDEINEMSDFLSNQIINGDITKHQALTTLGQFIEGEIKKYMVNLRTPPNAKSTVRKKGSNNPLIDKGFLIGAIRYAVKSGEPEATSEAIS